jgi:hypothetical protein
MHCSDELHKAIVISSVAIAPGGTAVDLASLFAAGAAETFNEFTVFNDADKAVKMEWTNDSTGKTDFCIVPNGGKGYTHKLGKGYITTTSLKLYSGNGSVLTGAITINLVRN